jgi:hypothetical protein
VTLAGAVSISDPDNLNLASATVSVAGGAFTGDGGCYRGHQHQHELRQQQRAAASGSDTLAHLPEHARPGHLRGRRELRLEPDKHGDLAATSTVATTTVSITNAERKIRGFGGSSSAAPASRARLVNGRTTSVMANMVRAGLATVYCDRAVEVTRVWITDAGRRALAGRQG